MEVNLNVLLYSLNTITHTQNSKFCISVYNKIFQTMSDIYFPNLFCYEIRKIKLSKRLTLYNIF